MKIKTFRARSMTDCLRLVKQEFGPSAVILNTRTSGAKLLGLSGREVVEITAARDSSEVPPVMRPAEPVSRRSTQKQAVRQPPGRDSLAFARPEDGGQTLPHAESVVTTRAAPHSRPGISAAELRSDLQELKALVARLAPREDRPAVGDWPQPLLSAYQSLVAARVAERLARTIVDRVRASLPAERMHDADAVRRSLCDEIEKLVPTSGPIDVPASGGSRVIALVGPTGVGKTTTIAKLAAQFRLRHGKRVGLVTIDTYRIGAIRQLSTYAEIIDVPLRVAATPTELSDALRQLADCDVVLIDTAGRSQRDQVKLSELREFFAQYAPHEIHLVLSCTCDESTLHETINRFGVLAIDRVILTKLDEAVGFGVVLSCLDKAGVELSYVTNGQDVPDDICAGNPASVARLVVAGNCDA